MSIGSETRAAGRLGAFDLRDPPDLEGIRACVHCGICLPQCPTYRVLGQEMDSPRGRIYLMRAAAEGRLALTRTLVRHLDLCLGCPAGVPFGRLLEAARGQIERRALRPLGERLLSGALLGLFSHPKRLGLALGGARVYRRSGLQRLVRATRLLAPWGRLRALEALLPASPPGGDRPLPEVVAARGKQRGTVGLLLGCVQSLLFPRVNAETARVLAGRRGATGGGRPSAPAPGPHGDLP